MNWLLDPAPAIRFCSNAARLSIAHLNDVQPRTPEKWPRLARAYLGLAEADAKRLERLLFPKR